MSKYQILIKDERAKEIMRGLIDTIKAPAHLSSILVVETDDSLLAAVAETLANGNLGDTKPAGENHNGQKEAAAAAGPLASPAEPVKRRRRSRAEMAELRAEIAAHAEQPDGD